MNVKVFYRCDYSVTGFFTKGKEYYFDGESVLDDDGDQTTEDFMKRSSICRFTRIERQTFDRDGVEWFEIAAESMPDLTKNRITVLRDEFNQTIGWRYADEQKPAGKPKREADDLADSCVAAMDWHPESEGERNYRLKQEAIRKAEKEAQEARDKRMRADYDILSKDFTNKHDSKMGWK